MATNHTENYQLNLWEPEDAFVREEFNENGEKIEAALVNHDAALDRKFGTDNMPWIVGSYIGDGTDERDINLGFQPTFLFVIGNNTAYRGYAITAGDKVIAHGPTSSGHAGPDYTLFLTETGFKVKPYIYSKPYQYPLNYKDYLYVYFAIR